MMQPPPAQILQVPLRTASLDEDIDPKQAAPGTLLALRNAVWLKAGRVEKRPGTEDLPTSIIGGGNLGTLEKIWARGSELVVTDGEDLFSYVPARSAWKRVQRLSVLRATWRTASDSARAVNAADLDATASLIAIAWTSDGSERLHVQVEDATTGALLVPPCELPVSARVRHFRVLIKGTTLLVFWQEASDTNIKAASIDLTDDVIASDVANLAPVDLLDDVAESSTSIWDVAHNGDNFTLLYKNTSNELLLVSFSTTFSLLAGVEVTEDATINGVALSVTPGEHAYAAYSTADDETPAYAVHVAVHDPSTLAQTTAPVNQGGTSFRVQHLSVARLTSSSAIVACTTGAAAFLGIDSWLSTDRQYTFSYAISSTAVRDLDSTRLTRWARLCSRVFIVDGRAYALLSSVRPPIILPNGARVSQNTVFAVEIETSYASAFGVGQLPHKMVAVIDPRESEGLRCARLCNVPVVDGTAYGASLQLSPGRAALRLITLKAEDEWSSTALGRTLVMAAGVGSVYDGRLRFEIGHLHAPRVVSATPGTDGSMAAGTYLYSFVYEWRDATGLLHRSAPSQPVKVTVESSGSVAFEIEIAATTGKYDLATGLEGNPMPVMIVPYRTKVGGTTFYRMTIDPNPVGLNGNAVIENDAYADDRALWTDTRADDAIDGSSRDLGTQPVLYTTGGILDEVIPPSCHHWTTHQGRLFGIAGDQRTVWASKVYLEDPGVFPGFNEALRIVFEDEVIALASLDDKLVAFSETAIWIVFGEGPNAAGLGSWEPPNAIQSDVGCIDAKSVVEVPAGVMFQSARGIYLLTRGLELQWIGQAVRDHVEAYPVVLDARLVPHRSQVRYAMSNVEGTAGVVLVFDYAHGFWSVFDYHDGSQASALVRSSVVVGSTLYMTASSALVKESSSSWLDRGAHWVTLELEAMLRPSGPIAWQHVRRLQLLGERATNHDLRLRLAFDDRSTYSQDFTFPAEMVATNNDCPTVRIGSQNGANPRCKAIRLRVTDATPTNPSSYPVTTGRGGWWSAIGLELIPKPGLPRHGARHSKV